MTDLPAPAPEWLRAPTLPGRAVTLEALRPEHAADLHAGATEDTIRFLARGGPTAQTVPAWAEYIERLNALPRRVNFAVRLGTAGPVVGRVSYSEVRPEDRWAEIGTMLLPAAQGTAVNPDAKRLLLARAFEALGAGRVQFKVDARNERSLRAMRRLGAVQEGVLRAYQVRPDGQARDSVMFSILAAEWPGVRAALDRRLDRLVGPNHPHTT
ncbi:GNAT family N-acetyltransferase [Deinococcus arcticus]|uniref:N-acetyltransferase n=1 Tax=Deinococcus arcticus TaxID=2136176 RepID=A0A2T3WCX4_9DEIO|nr:GNAT family protein [Deinococcus arcticus]PTA69739.1 N-acetyltransferase [Deinococcus arcticus]